MLLAVLCAGACNGADWDPFDGAPAGKTPPPIRSHPDVPANNPQLSVARPYAVFTDGGPLSIAPGGNRPTASAAADWYQLWEVDASVGPAALIALRRDWGIRGRVIAGGDLETVLKMGQAADYPGVAIRPTVTGDPLVNRYGVGYFVRMAADLDARIPLPTLDLRSVSDGGWAVHWVDDCVRNGVAGIRVLLPDSTGAAAEVKDALAKLIGPNVYLPPPSEVAILVGEPARSAAFQAYAGLRASGVWPEFVAESQITTRAVSLARYRVLVVPSLPSMRMRRTLNDWAGRGLTIVVLGGAESNGARVIARSHDGDAAITKRRTGDGRWIGAGLAPWSADGGWRTFWDGLLADAGVPRRPWLEAVAAGNVGVVTGRYTRPAPAR